MPDSLRQQRLEAAMVLLQAIEQPNGYQTNAGRAVFLGEAPALGEDDPDVALAIVPGDTQLRPHRMVDWPIEIQGVAKATLEQPWVAAEAALADIATAVEGADRTLGGLVKHIEVGATRTLAREDGSTTVGFAQTYVLTYVREWGAP